jgi:hypothetical protein
MEDDYQPKPKIINRIYLGLPFRVLITGPVLPHLATVKVNGKEVVWEANGTTRSGLAKQRHRL